MVPQASPDPPLTFLFFLNGNHQKQGAIFVCSPWISAGLGLPKNGHTMEGPKLEAPTHLAGFGCDPSKHLILTYWNLWVSIKIEGEPVQMHRRASLSGTSW